MTVKLTSKLLLFFCIFNACASFEPKSTPKESSNPNLKHIKKEIEDVNKYFEQTLEMLKAFTGKEMEIPKELLLYEKLMANVRSIGNYLITFLTANSKTGLYILPPDDAEIDQLNSLIRRCNKSMELNEFVEKMKKIVENKLQGSDGPHRGDLLKRLSALHEKVNDFILELRQTAWLHQSSQTFQKVYKELVVVDKTVIHYRLRLFVDKRLSELFSFETYKKMMMKLKDITHKQLRKLPITLRKVPTNFHVYNRLLRELLAEVEDNGKDGKIPKMANVGSIEAELDELSPVDDSREGSSKNGMLDAESSNSKRNSGNSVHNSPTNSKDGKKSRSFFKNVWRSPKPTEAEAIAQLKHFAAELNAKTEPILHEMTKYLTSKIPEEEKKQYSIYHLYDLLNSASGQMHLLLSKVFNAENGNEIKKTWEDWRNDESSELVQDLVSIGLLDRWMAEQLYALANHEELVKNLRDHWPQGLALPAEPGLTMKALVTFAHQGIGGGKMPAALAEGIVEENMFHDGRRIVFTALHLLFLAGKFKRIFLVNGLMNNFDEKSKMKLEEELKTELDENTVPDQPLAFYFQRYEELEQEKAEKERSDEEH